MQLARFLLLLLRGLMFAFFLLIVSASGTVQAQTLRFVPVFHKVGPVAGGFGGILFNPNGVATDVAGNLYIADTSNRVIRKVDPTLTTTIFAGNGFAGTSGDGGPAIAAAMTTPIGIAADLAGNVYVSDVSNNVVRKIDRNGVITRFAGTGVAGSSGDGALATAAQIVPNGITTDSLGNVYIVDTSSATIRVVRSSGVITRYAGGGNLAGSAADAGPALLAQIAPGSLTSDVDGNLFLGDTYSVRRIDKQGTITTVAGTGTFGYTGDGGAATAARIYAPAGLAVDPAGNLFIGDANSRRIRMVSGGNGVITTVAGNGQQNSVNDGLPGDKEGMGAPSALAADNLGNLYIAVGAANAIYSLALHPEVFPQTKVGLTSPTQRLIVENTGAVTRNLVSVAVSGDFHLAGTPLANSMPCNPIFPLETPDYNYCTLDVVFTPTAEGIRSFPVTITSDDSPAQLVQTLSSTGLGAALAMTSGQMFTVAGRYHTTSEPFNNGDGGPALAAALVDLNGIAVNSAGDIFFTEYPACQIRRVDGNTGVLTLFAGQTTGFCMGSSNYVSGDGGPAVGAVMNGVSSLALNASNSLFVSTTWDSRIRAIDSNGIITTVAGIGGGSGNTAACGYTADGVQATMAALCAPNGIAFDKNGNMFFAETGNNLVRKVSTNGVLTTIAGNHALGLGFSGDGGPGIAAQLNQPKGVTVNDAGDVFISDSYNHVIRKVSAATGIITTVAGQHGVQGYRGDGGPASAAKLYLPEGLSIDAAGDVFIADRYNHVVRKIDTAGIITTVAGTQLVGGYNGDGHAATATQLRYPNQVAVSSAGYLYVTDADHLIREMSPNGSLIFAPRDVNTTSPAQSVTLSNIGNMPLHFDAQFPTGIVGDFALSGGTCNFTATLSVGGSCTVDLTFTPTAAGARNGIFGFFDDGVASPQYVALLGTGLQKQAQAIQFTAIPNKVYGDPSFTLAATSNSGLPITFTVVSGSATVAVAGSTATITGTGPVTVGANQAGDASWQPATQVTRSFNVSPALLTVTAQPASSQAGQPLAPLTKTITGFVYGENSNVLSGAFSLSTTATSNGVAGTYPIIAAAGNIQSANYTFNYLTGVYTLTAAPGPPPMQAKIVLVTSFTLVKLPSSAYQATIKVANQGTITAPNVIITSSKLAALNGTPLSVPLGNIPVNGSAVAVVLFSGGAGPSGAVVVEQFTGSYTGGTFGGSGHITLP